MTAFTLTVDQNPHLPAGGREMHAVLGVRAESGGGGVAAAQIIIIDTSGSMGYAGRMKAAKAAARAALATIRDGVAFAVIAGANTPRMVYPSRRNLVRMDAASREAAQTAVARMVASGGTAIGTWLVLANRLFEGRSEAVRHAILLTDGKNQHERPEELGRALDACRGGFVCDALGVGTDWAVADLRRITSALLGAFLDVPEPADLERRFRELTETAMDKEVGDVALRVWTPRHATLRFLKQMVPVLDDLTGKGVPSGPQTIDFPLGAWGAEEREYHLCVEIPAGDIGRRMRAAQARLLLADGAQAASGDVLAEWTDDVAKATLINGRVARHTDQAELAEAVQEGLAARRDGDEDTATARLGRAVVLAREVGNDQVAELLDRVVDVLDPVSGTVRLKKDVDKADEMSLDTRSVRTVRTRTGEPATSRTARTRPGDAS
ncbi:VWA domain-containing protein [Actinomadura rayongensis]|uniref:VWA domain-containing protein n=1 Tax=Actinomadura rayongensis TaxID=1429076 RepID=A0A6I4W889_9ACTN|nr:VWA domain-containing protein [Actinomadura rayongensis]MXQ66939.1 VWA domain-containing protein [Actinomadura rayongensis]